MIGDKLDIRPHHTARAAEICTLITTRYPDRMVVTVGGESGAGKSEVGAEIVRLLVKEGIRALVESPAVGRIHQKWREGGYLEKGVVPKDPWGYEYILDCRFRGILKNSLKKHLHPIY